MSIKSEKKIAIMQEGGKILAETLKKLSEAIRPGVTTWELEELANELIKKYPGSSPAFKDYVLNRPFKGYKSFPTALCVSINDEVVHAVPLPPPEEKVINPGDVVNIDFGVRYKGFVTDSAITILVPNGKDMDLKRKLIQTTKECLNIGISKAKIGNTVGDIGSAIQKHAQKNNFSVIYTLVGHGISKELHEDPDVPNYGIPGKGEALVEDMTIAIEPMLTAGKPEVKENRKTLAWETKDGSLAAHFEHTVAITKNGPLILTE